MIGAVDFRHMTAAEANERIEQFKAIYAAVFSRPPYNKGPEMADKFVEWVRQESTEPGFDFVQAVEYGVAIGFAYGYSRPAGRWWAGADRPAPAQVQAGPTFTVMDWAVLPDRRGKGVGRALMDELLAGRTEPYAVLTVNPDAAARRLCERLGWRHVAATQPGNSPGMDVMLLKLPTRAAA
jgi:ribosomal protein S18 acetylase RimI-like enzyme